ncbi:MAG: type I 3-dehydroquinate dehydratase [Candidatus Bathyarchaeia archaeon]
MTLRVCVSILPQTVAKALELVARAEESGADLLEVRLDALTEAQGLQELAARGTKPKIATDKSGRAEAEHSRMLLAAAKSGFSYVDVDLSSPNLRKVVEDLKALGAKCIISSHDDKRTPSLPELRRVLAKQILNGADMCKIVTTAKRMEDNLSLLQFTAEASTKANVVCFAMGEQGRISRVLSPAFGGFFTFASLARGSETAPGQLTVEEVKAAYRLLGLE